MLTSASFVVRKERGRKVLSLVEPERQNSEKSPRLKKDKAGLVRKREVARSVVRYFHPYTRKVVSVFGAKAITKEEMRLLSLVASRVFDFTLYFMGVAESADSGPHAHFVAFKEIKGEPCPLTPAEEKSLCTSMTTYLFAWRNRANKKLRPSRFLLRKSKPSLERPESRSFYRVPKLSVDGRSKPSGVGSGALSYTLKSMLSPKRSSEFIASVGLTSVVSLVRSKQEVRVKQRKLWSKHHSTFNFALISMAAYEAEKQLRYLKPNDVSVYIKYGRVFADINGKLKLHRNVYLLVGMELLRRDLMDFSSASVLRRSVSKVCKALCPAFKQLTTEQLNKIARMEREAIVWAAERKANG